MPQTGLKLNTIPLPKQEEYKDYRSALPLITSLGSLTVDLLLSIQATQFLTKLASESFIKHEVQGKKRVSNGNCGPTISSL